MKVTVLPAAEADVLEAAAFYEVTGSALVAAKFVSEFKRVADLLLEFPDIGAPRSRGRRGFGLSLFPYTIIYRPQPDGITVLVVKHDRRRPDYGGGRK
jgi:plasmid stabilization system protein ParE